MLKVVEASGDYYTCGKIFGASCKESIAYRLKNELKEDSVARYKEELEEVNTLCQKLYPEYVQELEGIAEGSGVDYWELLLLNTPELMERSQGCTTVAVAGDTQLYLVHNEDGESHERSEDCVLLHYTLPHTSFYAFTYAGELAGGSYSWNSQHLYFSVNYLEPIQIQITDRVSRNFVARKIIEVASIEDALSVLAQGQDASGYHYFMGQGDELVSIENFGNETSVEKVVSTSVHANHYLHSQFLARSVLESNSVTRQKRAEELTHLGTPPLQILADRSDLPDAICSRLGEGLHTISTIGFYPREKKVILYEPGTLQEDKVFTL